jgi:two-component system sensor histidine kinase GraS
MKGKRLILACLDASKLWLILLLCTTVLFIFFAWLAYPESFKVLVGLMVVITLGMMLLPLAILLRSQKIIEDAFNDFISEPDREHEYALCQVTPMTHWPYIHQFGQLLRANQAAINDQIIQLADYERYIESWVHEIKTPLSLMTLVLDNRSDEMSPLVRQRMLQARDRMHGDVERILYFARLGAVHKDYLFEPLALLDACREAVEDHRTLLEESGFSVNFTGKELEVVSDRKGLAFILGQIIGNSVKYAAQTERKPLLQFAVDNDEAADRIVLNISDNGPGVPSADLPFIFDKGFTGERGNCPGRATGMGLFLVRKMARDLAIGIDATSEPSLSLTISLSFPKLHL